MNDLMNPAPVQTTLVTRTGRVVWMVLCLAILALSGHAAQTFYVAPTGNDTNSGAQTQPFRQIRQALALVAPGDTILVADGSYLGFDAFNKTGTDAEPIIVRATGTNAVVTKTTDRSDNRDTIHVEDCSHLVVDGLRSFNANRAALRIEGGDHVAIRNCTFGNNATWGILTGHSEDLLIENNECYASATQHGIYVANSADNPVVRGNRCHDNGGAGVQLNADFSIQPGDGIITGALLENNVIYNNGAMGGGAFNLDGVQDSIVRNNLLFNNHASGIIFFQIDGAEGPRSNQVYHNTIDMPADGRWALNFLQTTGTNVARNNILLTHNASRGGLRFGDATDVANTDSDYNIVTRITPDDSTVLTLAQWQAQGHELHSVTSTYSTEFVDDMMANYHLKTNSPALNAAQVLTGPLADLEGMTRPFGTASDIGCYELSDFQLSISQAGNGRYLLRLTGGSGRTYQLDASGAPGNWASAATFTRSNRPLEFLETNTTGAGRFYRASLLP